MLITLQKIMSRVILWYDSKGIEPAIDINNTKYSAANHLCIIWNSSSEWTFEYLTSFF